MYVADLIVVFSFQALLLTSPDSCGMMINKILENKTTTKFIKLCYGFHAMQTRTTVVAKVFRMGDLGPAALPEANQLRLVGWPGDLVQAVHQPTVEGQIPLK